MTTCTAPLTYVNHRLVKELPSEVGRAFLLLNKLMSRWRQNGGVCMVGQRQLADYAKVTDRTIRNWERRLESLGIIQIERSVGRSRIIRMGAWWQKLGLGTPEKIAGGHRKEPSGVDPKRTSYTRARVFEEGTKEGAPRSAAPEAGRGDGFAKTLRILASYGLGCMSDLIGMREDRNRQQEVFSALRRGVLADGTVPV